eukprot:Skav230192  [mRNA]  locus=scaffold1418:98407:108964:- [translate_table: standard]
MGSSTSNLSRDPSQIRSIFARWIATAESGVVLENHVLCIENGRIAEILPKAQFGGEPDLNLPSHILIPGLINAHTHTPMSLLRGYADDLPLNEWLFQHIFPTEGKFVFEAPAEEAREFVRRGSELACYEMLKTGTTMFNDMYFHGDATASVARQAGMKAVLTQAGLLYFGDDAAFSGLIKQNVEFCSALVASKDSHIRPSLLPHSVYMVPEEKLQEVKLAYDEALSGSHVVIHTHLNETKKEIDDLLSKTGKSAIQSLDSLGLLNSRTVAAHCVHMTDEEIKLMAERKGNVAHCPRSNLKLGSGIARTADMLKAGVNVCLGTDGASSNNTLDLLTENLGLTQLAKQSMQYASMLAKGSTGDPTVLPAHEVLEMATIRGARALGLDNDTGSIRVTSSDSVYRLIASPIFDPLGQLVYTNSRQGDETELETGLKLPLTPNDVGRIWALDCAGQSKLLTELLGLEAAHPPVARREIICDFHLFNLSHAKMLCLTQRQGADMMAGWNNAEGATAAECFKEFQRLLLDHAVNDPPKRRSQAEGSGLLPLSASC